MNYNKTFFVIFIFPLCLAAGEILPAKSWFSDKIEFRSGYEFIQLLIQDNKFILAKLNFNQERRWEETRIIGTVQKNSNLELDFFPEMCSVYATKKLSLRWILTQGFDCDHIKIQFTKNRQEIIISPSIGIQEKYTLKTEQNPSEDSISGIVVEKEEQLTQIWGLQIRYLKKGSTASNNGFPLQLLETVDSTGSIVSSEFIKIGDIIKMNAAKSKGLFD